MLPDIPRWVYARSLLKSRAPEVRLAADRDAALILDPTSAALVGRPDPLLLREALAGDPPGPALLVQDDAVLAVQTVLPGWVSRPFIVHALPQPYPANAPPAEGVVVSLPLDRTVLDGLPDDVRADALDAPAAAVRIVDGIPVAVCAVSDLTEGLWDVGIDTVEPARRQGHATVAFRALAAAMAAQGRQPVWAAYDEHAPSLALAARLGFLPVARMIELLPPQREADQRPQPE